MRTLASTFLFFGLLCFAAGCGGSSGIVVTGKVTKGGAAYQPQDPEKLSVILDSKDKSYEGNVQSDGTFKITGAKDEGVLPATYEIKIVHYPAKITAPPMPISTGVTWNVSAEQKDFTLDISKLLKK